MKVFLILVNLFVISLLALKLQPGDKRLRIYYWSGLTLKLIAGVCLGLVYMYYYSGGDTFTFYTKSLFLSEFAKQDFWKYVDFLWSSDASINVWTQLPDKPRALFIVKLISVVNLISGDSYWIASLYFSFLSFLGAWSLFKTVVNFYKDATVSAGIAFLFFPSCIFWTSGVLKESVAMGCLFYLSAWVLKSYHHVKWQVADVVFIPLSIWMVWNLKYYFLGIFFPVTIALLASHVVITKWFQHKPKPLTNFLFFLALIVLFASVTFLHPNFEPGYFQEVIVSNYYDFVSLSDPEDVIQYYHLTSDVGSIVMNSPLALLSGLFRPFVWESHTVFQFMSALENTFLLVLFIFTLANVKLVLASFRQPMVLALIVYIVLLCVFLALSTPNFGTLSRYRVGFIPFFVFLITYKNPLIESVANILQKKK